MSVFLSQCIISSVYHQTAHFCKLTISSADKLSESMPASLAVIEGACVTESELQYRQMVLVLKKATIADPLLVQTRITITPWLILLTRACICQTHTSIGNKLKVMTATKAGQTSETCREYYSCKPGKYIIVLHKISNPLRLSSICKSKSPSIKG